ncbi:MAG: hypothetical protein IT244_02185 [Bacteroidia bacterium]|nr:hypothetical protein [Bacteroidia bacterium]
MKLKNWLSKWNLSSLKINAEFLELELTFDDIDKKAAWEMYVELLTRITTQPLKVEDGDEGTALTSVYNLFPVTRDILKKYGADSITFAKIAIIILNQIIRPFTAKWHRLSIQGAFKDPGRCLEFRQELEQIQGKLVTYSKLLSDIAGVEDLTTLEIE